MKEPEEITCVTIRDGGGVEKKSHTHSTWEDLAACVGGNPIMVMVSAPPTEPKAPVTGPMAGDSAPVPRAVPAVPPTAPETGVAVKHKTARPTPAQLYKISKLGGSWRDATENNREEVSQLIRLLDDATKADMFKLPETVGFDDEAWDLYPKEVQWRQGSLPDYWATMYTWDEYMQGNWRDGEVEAEVPVSTRPAATPTMTAKTRLEAMLPLLDSVPDGYFAIDLDGDGKCIKYLRVDTPSTGRMKGARKIQTIHGDRLDDAWVLWPSKKVTVYWSGIEDLILALMTDHMGALRRYARTIGRCCRCRKQLTDARSRHYGIGPECEKYMPEIIHLVDLENSTD